MDVKRMTEVRVSIPKEVDKFLDAAVRTGMFANKAEILRAATMQFVNQIGPISKGFDRETMFSPDGRLYQVEYAREASLRGLTVVGGVCRDGVIIASEKSEDLDPLIMDPQKLYRINEKLVVGGAGIGADGWTVIKRLKKEEIHNTEDLLFAIHQIFWDHTVQKDLRPLGVSMLVATSMDSPQLFWADPSGAIREVNAWAIGEGEKRAQEELSHEWKTMEMKDAEKVFQKVLKNRIGEIVKIP
jgi:20S proteasome alpha/beta subunit